jgi:hypothetical protein
VVVGSLSLPSEIEVVAIRLVSHRLSISIASSRFYVAEALPRLAPDDLRQVWQSTEVHGHAFAEKKPNATDDKCVSLINRASIAALEKAVETPLAGFVPSAASPAARNASRQPLSVTAPITRCAATGVNPETVAHDRDVIAALRHSFGRYCFYFKSGSTVIPGRPEIRELQRFQVLRGSCSWIAGPWTAPVL